MKGYSIATISCKRCAVDFCRHHSAQRFCEACRIVAAQETRRKAAKAYLDRNRSDPDYRRKRTKLTRDYVARNAEAAQSYQREYARRNADTKRVNARKWREAHPERYRASVKAYREKNSSIIVARQKARHQKKLKADAAYAINCRMSSAVRKTLRDGKAGRSWESLVGYSLAELVTHLARQFPKGMNWENRGEWEIDHILPISSFSYEDENDPEFRICWGLANLRPLWSSENRRKQARIVSLL